MAAKIPVKAIFTGSDVTSLGEFASSDTINGSYITDNTVDEANLKISNNPTNGYVLTAQSGASGGMTWALDAATDSTKLPLSGGTMTGNLVMGTNLVDGIDISARDAVLTSTTTTAGAALPKAGGTMTGDLILGDNVKLEVGSASGGDLQIYHDASNSYIDDTGTGNLKLRSNKFYIDNADSSKDMAIFTDGGSCDFYHNNSRKLETSANGVTVTGGAVGTMTTDNDGSFAMSASNNFKCTPAGNFALTFTAIVAQSGNILFINSGGHTISAHANTKVDATLLATISTAGTYLLSYFSDGTNVYMTNSAAYA